MEMSKIEVEEGKSEGWGALTPALFQQTGRGRILSPDCAEDGESGHPAY